MRDEKCISEKTPLTVPPQFHVQPSLYSPALADFELMGNFLTQEHFTQLS